MRNQNHPVREVSVCIELLLESLISGNGTQDMDRQNALCDTPREAAKNGLRSVPLTVLSLKPTKLG